MNPKKMKRIIDRIVSVARPTKIILFGSQARGEAERDSDIDLLIIVKETESRRELAIQIMEALRDFHYAIDIIVATEYLLNRYGKIPGLVYEVALSEGVVLYGG